MASGRPHGFGHQEAWMTGMTFVTFLQYCLQAESRLPCSVSDSTLCCIPISASPTCLAAQALCLSTRTLSVAARRLSCPAACGILVSRPGIESRSPALEGGFLTTGPPGKSQLPGSWMDLLISLPPRTGRWQLHVSQHNQESRKNKVRNAAWNSVQGWIREWRTAMADDGGEWVPRVAVSMVASGCPAAPESAAGLLFLLGLLLRGFLPGWMAVASWWWFMAFGKCGCVLNREVKNNPAKGSTGQERGCHKTWSFTLENAGGGAPRGSGSWWFGPASPSAEPQLFRALVTELPLGSGCWSWPSGCG